MGFSEFFRFLIILYESIKLLPKNWKLMASIAVLSLILPSIFLLLFSYSFQSSMNDMTDSGAGFKSSQDTLKFWALLFVLEIVLLLLFIGISHLSGVATILVSATSYSGKNLSLQDLFSSIKSTWRRSLTTSFRVSRSSTRYFSFFVVLGILLVIISPNPITISIAIFVGVTFVVFQLYSSVVWALSYVVSIVEESFQGRDQALEIRAAELVEGQRLHGFMLNLFFNLLLSSIFLVCWMALGDKGSLNLTIYGLIFVNFTSFSRMLLFTAYTVFYFQCKKQHGEEIGVLGNLQYTKLPITSYQTGENDVP